jgi:hypothetical protein
VPDSLTVADGGSYAEPQVRVQALGVAPDLLLHYSATEDGSEPAEPTTESATLGDAGVVFEAAEGEELPVRIKLLPRLAGSTVTGRVRSLSFALDRRAPELPTVRGVEPGGAYTDARALELVPEEPSADTVELDIRRIEGTGEPVGMSLVYQEPLRLHGKAGVETLYEIRIRVQDRAGNETVAEEPLRILIDRQPPLLGAPRVRGAEGTSVFGMMSDGPVLLSAPEGVGLRYEIVEGVGSPAPVSDTSSALTETVELSGRDGTEVLYRVAYRSMDEAGNLSEETGTMVMEVDRRPPPPPEAPSVRVAEDGRSARLSWASAPGYRTGYRIVDDRERDLRRAENGSRIEFPPGVTALTVEAVQVDEVGNRSEPRRFDVRGFTVSPRPRLSGVENDAVYGETVVVRNSTPDATVRYELAVGEETPEIPTRFSEKMPETLPFDVAPGETVRYRLRARSFSEQARPSPDVALSFTVDRTAPPPPELVGARSGDFYTTSRSVELEAEQGRIRYRLSLVGDPSGEFRDYEEEVVLEAVPGRLAHYRLEAFTVDTAGNRSGAPRVWDLYIDQEIVYVAAAGDGGEADGSRTAPFTGLSEAVDFALSRDRRTIFVAGGRYTVVQPITVAEDLTIQGGLSAETWRREDDVVTEIVARNDGQDPLFAVTDASLTLESINLTVEATATITAAQARIFMQSVRIDASGVPGVVRSEGSAIEARGLEVLARDVRGGSVLAFGGGQVLLDAVRIDGSAAGRDLNVLEARGGASVEIIDSTLRGGPSRRGSVIGAEGATVRVTGSELRAGTGREGSDAVRATGSDVTIRDALLGSEPGSAIATLIGASGGSLRLEDSTLEIAAGRGATGVFARGTRISVSRNAFRAGTTGEFLHMVSLRDVRGVIDTNLFLGGETRELIVGRVVDSETSWYNNTIRGGAGSRFTQAFNLTGSSRTQLVNNIVFHASDATGTAVYASDGRSRLQAMANAFSGWDMVFRSSPDGRRWTPPGEDEATGARSAEELNRREELDADGNIDLSGRDIFADDVHLRTGAPVIDAGVYPAAGEGPSVDWDGQERPGPAEGTYDIGADEFFR